MDELNTVFSIWGKRRGYVFVPTKDFSTGKWNEECFRWPKERKKISRWVMESEKKKLSVYWCPTVFSQPIRKKEYVKSVQCLWADLDEVNPRKIKPKMRPHLAYQSSPGRYQGIWYLDRDYKPEEAEAVNRNITYYLGADKGGWDLTQVLRIPGSRNFKYKGGPKGKLLWNHDKSVSLDYFSFVPKVDDGEEDDIDGEVVWDEESDLRELVAKHRKRIRGRLFDLIFATAEDVEGADRSERLWELECRLLERGVPVADVVNIVRLSNWNKYRGRRDEKKRILTEVRKAYAEVKDQIITDKDDNRFRDRFGRVWTSYADLMGQVLSEPGWLVEGWWQKDSHGIVAGEPKTYKSTLVAEFATSVASGNPLFGIFPVHNPGPVIMIQEENSPFLMKDRFRKVANSKGLLKGKVKIKNKQTVDITFPPDLPIEFLNNRGFDFTEEESRELLEDKIKRIKPVLVIFDPLYLMLGGRDENSSKDLRPILNWLIHLRYTYRTAIMVVHHWNKSGTSPRGGQRMLGSVTLHGWVESAIYSILKDEQEHEVVIDREFRSFPKPKNLEVKYVMGNPGDDTYAPEVNDHAIPVDDEIVMALRASNGMTEKELIAVTGLGRTALRSKLEDLERKNLVYRDTSKRPTLWFAVTVEVEQEED